MPVIVRVIVREDHTSIFNSVYVQPAERLKYRGWDVQFVLSSFIGTWLRSEPRRIALALDNRLSKQFGRRVVRLPLPPARISRLWGSGDVMRAYAWFGKSLRELGDDTIFEGNNSEATTSVIKALGKSRRHPIVYRCWGIDEEEYLYALTGQCSRELVTGKHHREAERLFDRQKLAVEQSDHIVCVSDAMVDHLSKRFGCDTSKTSVVPCSVDTAPFISVIGCRDRIRSELGLENKLVLGYCGALQRYQMPREGIQLFKRILAVEPRAHYLIITRETEAILSLCNEAGVPTDSRTILSLDHKDVPQYLSAADAGLLLREKCAVNRVASPVKFAEYMAAGLPVVLSSEIGDYSDLVMRHKIGVVLDTLEPTEKEVEQIVELLRNRGGLSTACVQVGQMIDTEVLAEQLSQQFHSIFSTRKQVA